MDAVALAFRDGIFDVVACIQNGISAFKVDQRALVAESIRVARPGGRVLFSSYSERFWRDRLEWFRLQSEHGLLGEIDPEATGDGVIVCKDGFKATTIGPDEFFSLTSGFDVHRRIEEVDESSIFCEIVV
jgi:SAM-dependent methyltransferase